MYWFIFSYLAATISVLLLTQLIDFILLFCLAAVFYLCLLWRYQRIKNDLPAKPVSLLHTDVYALALFCLAAFFLGAFWASFYAYIKMNQVLPTDFESRDLYIEGRVIGLPKLESYRQSFDFQPEFRDDCAEQGVESKAVQKPETLCALYVFEKPRLQQRLFPLALSDWILQKSLFVPYINIQPSKLKLSWYGKDQEVIRGGDRYRLLVKLKRPRASVNFTGFDYESWLFSENYQAVGYVRSKGDNSRLAGAAQSFQGKKYLNLSAHRESLRQQLLGMLLEQSDLHFKSIPQNRALILALVLGDRSFLNSSTRELLVQTGTAHLLAISGMHIGLLSLITFFTVFQSLKAINWFLTQMANRFVLAHHFKFPYRSRLYMAVLLSLLVAFVYALLAGFSLPTQRALIMVACYSVSLLLFVKPDFFKTWCVALFLVLLWHPLAWLSSGLYLSFLAVLVIQWSLLGRPILVGKKFRKTRIMWRSQLAVFIGLAPVLMYIFSAFFPVAILLNLFAIPWVSFLILPLCFLGVLLMFINVSWAIPVFFWVESLLTIFLTVLQQALIVFSGHLSSSISFIATLALFVFVLLLLSPMAPRIKVVSLFFLLPLLIDWFGGVSAKNKIPQGEFSLSVLDVGQGLALMVETRKHLLVYDTGPAFGENFDAGSAMVVPALREKLKWRLHKDFKKQIDALVLSHGDNDHIGGVQSVLSRFTPAQVWSYQQLEDQNRRSVTRHLFEQSQAELNWQECQKGQYWYWDDVKFEFLHPGALLEEGISAQEAARYQRVHRAPNNRSCVLKVSSPSWASSLSMLLPGDIEKLAEQYLVESLAPEVLKSNILISPHHGSRSSSTLSFLQAVNPDLVLISAGYRSQFGHPHSDTLANYAFLNVPAFNTADYGEIRLDSWVLDSEKNHPAMQFARKHKARFWRLD